MKATTAERNECTPMLRYPNAATRRQIIHKVLDFLIMVASGIGVGAMLLFVLANA